MMDTFTGGSTMRLAIFLLAAGVAGAAVAQNDIYVCEDADGHKSYQSSADKGCKRLTTPLVSVPAARLPVGGANSRATEQRVAPTNFPRVDGETQRARDNDRRRILEDELRSEEDKLARLRTEYNNGTPERQGDERNFARYQERTQRLAEEVQRAESNVSSLRRELALLRQQ